MVRTNMKTVQLFNELNFDFIGMKFDERLIDLKVEI